jgi:hypothetical protein
LKLLVKFLETTLEQDFTCVSKKNVKAVRIHLYKALDPAGTFTLSIKSGANTLVSKSLTSAEIGFTHLYMHGWVTFEFDSIVNLIPGTYTLELGHSGYDSSSFAIGWRQEHEDLINTPSGNVFTNPLAFQIWSYDMATRVLDFDDSFTSASQPTDDNIFIAIDGFYYIGDADTDDSWRFSISSGNLLFEKRVSGSWISSHEMGVS